MTYKEEGCNHWVFIHVLTFHNIHVTFIGTYTYVYSHCIADKLLHEPQRVLCGLFFSRSWKLGFYFSEHDRRSYYYIIMRYNMMQTPHVRRDVICNFSPERTRCTRHPFYPVRIHRSTITLSFLRLAASSCVQVSAPGRPSAFHLELHDGEKRIEDERDHARIKCIWSVHKQTSPSRWKW